MKTMFAIGLAILVGIGGARAQQAEMCGTPGYFMFGDSLLEQVAKAVAQNNRLKIVVFGTTSSTLAGQDGARDAYPARLEATLRRLLPGVTVNVATYARPRQLADKMIKGFDKAVQDEKPDLAIWQTGTFDAMQGVDPKEFLLSVTQGVEKLKAAGVDVILVNMQYNPRTESMLALEAYAENMRWVARERQVPLFDRLAIMRYWNDSGTVDLYAAGKDLSVAKRVHECVGRALASLIIDAGRLNTVEGKSQR